MTDFRAGIDNLCSQAIDIGLDMGELVRMVKRAYIMEELKRAKGNQSRAARALGMHRNTLERDMRQLNIPRHSDRRRDEEQAA